VVVGALEKASEIKYDECEGASSCLLSLPAPWHFCQGVLFLPIDKLHKDAKMDNGI
jgi:hypothetical protein